MSSRANETQKLPKLLMEQKPKIILHGVDGISYANCPNCGKRINDSDNPYCCEYCG